MIYKSASVLWERSLFEMMSFHEVKEINLHCCLRSYGTVEDIKILGPKISKLSEAHLSRVRFFFFHDLVTVSVMGGHPHGKCPSLTVLLVSFLTAAPAQIGVAGVDTVPVINEL